MKHTYLFILILFLCCTAINAQPSIEKPIDPKNITIVRDTYGIPHIYAKTDAEACYGMTWAMMEDTFTDIEMMVCALRGRAGEIHGKEGAALDIISFTCDLDRIVDEQFDTAFSDEFRKVLAAKVQATNDYVEMYPKKLKIKKGIFPITAKDVIKLYVFGNVVMSNAVFDIAKIVQNKISSDIDKVGESGGSNAWAFSKNKTKEETTWMVSNSHQPLEGPFSWYEAHISSEEGWNMMGATFPIGLSIFVGTNPNLGWTHTVNYPDLSDMYRLEMHPKNKLQYKFDDEWLTLEKRKLNFKVKIGPVKIPLSKTFYWSKHGMVGESKEGFFAVRMPALMDIRAAEQWYHMNKAQNFEEFKTAMEIQGIASLNAIYADKDDNIFLISNALSPKRDSKYNWTEILDGNTSDNVWKPEFYTIEDMAQVLNPKSGYVYNTNNTPGSASGEGDNPDLSKLPSTMGYLTKENNRSLRFQQLFEPYANKKISYDEFKVIKYDQHFHTKTFYSLSFENMDDIISLNLDKYPDLKDVSEILRKWDRSTNVENEQAALMSMIVYNLIDIFAKELRLMQSNVIPEDIFIEAIRKSKKHLKKHFGSLEIPLGELQKHVRGDKIIPVGGMPDNLAAMMFDKYKKGQLRTYHGDSFIQFVQYDKNGVVKVEAINAYGNSRNEDSPHYDDQMEMFVNRELRTMTFDKETIMKNAKKIYSPGEVIWE